MKSLQKRDKFIKDVNSNEKWCIENLIKSEVHKSI